jgi:tetratricopeptide (TPR) repeat protein
MKRLIAVFALVAVCQIAFSQDFLGKALGSLTAGDTAAAITNFKEALKANQKADQANFYLGSIALARGQVEDAISFLEASLKFRDENVKALKQLGDAYVMKKDNASALIQYRKAEKLAPKDPEVLTSSGLALLAADSVDAAIRTLVLAKEYNPNDPRIYKGLGAAYRKQGVVVLAVTNYQKAIELDPKDVKTRFILAQVFEKNRQYTEAVKEYDGAIAADSSYSEAYLAKGNILVAAKLYTRAIPPLKKYLTFKPASVEGSVLLAKAYFGAEDFVQAAKEAKNSLGKDSGNVDVWRIEAHSLTETKDYTGAIAAFGALQRRNALAAGDQAKYGIALYGLGREEEAMKALLAAIEADSTNCDPYFSLGSIYMKRQEFEKAAAMFEKKIVCDPRSLSTYVNAAASYRQIKNYPRMRELLMKALELKPDFLMGRTWLARYYTEVDSLEQAKLQYDEVLKEAATNPEKYKREMGEAYYLLASYYFQKQQFGQSVESCKKASGVSYDNSPLHLMWGQAILQTLDPKGDPADNRKKVEESIKHFRRSIELDANNAVAHLWLGQGLVLSRVEGDDAGNAKLKEEACNEYRKVLKIDPRNEDAKKGMERIGCK